MDIKVCQIFGVFGNGSDITIIYNSNYFRNRAISETKCTVITTDNKQKENVPISIVWSGDNNGTGEFSVLGKVQFENATRLIIDGISYPISFVNKNQQQLTLIALIHNMNAYLKEWINFHLQLGFARIILYDNFTDDKKELSTIVESFSGKVILEQFSHNKFIGDSQQLQQIKRDPFKFHFYVPQCEQLNCALYKYGPSSSHIAFTDIDEFIFGSIKLNELKAKTHYILESYSFGCVPQQPEPGYSIVKHHLYRKPTSEGPSIRTKAIVDPRYVKVMGVHTPIIVEPGSIIERPKIESLRINHYMFRCYADRFYREKRIENCPHGVYDSHFDCENLRKAQEYNSREEYKSAYMILKDIPICALRFHERLEYLDSLAQSAFTQDFEVGKKAQSELLLLLQDPSAQQYLSKHSARIQCNNLFYDQSFPK